jgi:hypothetical protein
MRAVLSITPRVSADGVSARLMICKLTQLHSSFMCVSSSSSSIRPFEVIHEKVNVNF